MLNVLMFWCCVLAASFWSYVFGTSKPDRATWRFRWSVSRVARVKVDTVEQRHAVARVVQRLELRRIEEPIGAQCR